MYSQRNVVREADAKINYSTMQENINQPG